MKREPSDLAIFGGSPAFNRPLHVGRPHLGDRQTIMDRFEEVLDSRWLTNHGHQVEEFERGIEDYLGVAHCVATCNGTAALQIAARAAGALGSVLVPSFTFVATAHALSWLGLTPVFCDVDAATHNIDPQAAIKLISPDVSAIVAVHLWGRPCATNALDSLAREHDLKLIYDASHAFGCNSNGAMIGSHGDAEIFSFHATKALGAGEGGALVTDDPDLAERARLMRNFGFADYDRVVSPGTNAKMSELAAAMGRSSLDGFDGFVAANRANHLAYREGLDGIPGLSLVAFQEEQRPNFHYTVAEVNEDGLGLSRDLLYRALWEENVLARRYFYPGVHRMEPYRSLAPEAGARLPNTNALSRRTLVLPSGGELRPADVTAVCELIRFLAEHAAAVSSRVPTR